MNNLIKEIENQVIRYQRAHFHREELVIIIDNATYVNEMCNDMLLIRAFQGDNSITSFLGIPLKVVDYHERLVCVALNDEVV